MDQSLQCNMVGHQGYPINAICKNAKCKHPSHVCMKCLLELHKSHQSDCILLEVLNSQTQTYYDFAKLRKQINLVIDELEQLYIRYMPGNISEMTLSQLDQYGKQLRVQESQSTIRGNLQVQFERMTNQITKQFEQLKLMMKPYVPIKQSIPATPQPKQNIPQVPDVPIVKSPKFQFILENEIFSNVFNSKGEPSSVMVHPNLDSTTDRSIRIQFKIITCFNGIRIGITRDTNISLNQQYSSIFSDGYIYSTSSIGKGYQKSGMPFQAGDIIDCVIDKANKKVTLTNLITSQSCCFENECMDNAKLFVYASHSAIEILG